ncbi:hypothetical protein [Flavobacterium hercynium]|uniref:Uncharacterized protein n=1 Tax=Flavobacterium hercynium TaxID=387094 RepID=A0A226GWP2_9FLAO|nr:hypothetical protein [Flavobacterium hercynium]OXA85700.1 hypothetical protein B0A66_19045 [Flavobacterium hercynium]SMP30237.1 hypothetical protein SAMN06265346_1133 [Flavobacterium hercynium]
MKKIIILTLYFFAFVLQSCDDKTKKQGQVEIQKTIETKNGSVFENNVQSKNKKNDNIVLGEDISEINAYAKRIYKINGVIYIDLDLVEIRYPTKGEWDAGDREIVNNNPKIRTYVIDNNTSILSNVCKELKSSELFQIRESVLKDKNIIIIGRSENGKMQEINFGCYG